MASATDDELRSFKTIHRRKTEAGERRKAESEELSPISYQIPVADAVGLVEFGQTNNDRTVTLWFIADAWRVVRKEFTSGSRESVGTIVRRLMESGDLEVTS